MIMDYEKAYKEATGWMRKIYPTLTGTNKEDAEHYFPELKESEDERIRKELLKEIEFISPRDGETDGEGLILPSYHARIDRYKSYLEKQKEQKPAEWSEEFLHLMGITISQDGNQMCVLLGENLAEGIAGFGDTLADAVEEFKKEWRQFDRFRKATWKPSEEQMEALNEAKNFAIKRLFNGPNSPISKIIESLYNDLKKL